MKTDANPTNLRNKLLHRKSAKVAEILVVFIPAFVVLLVVLPFVGENPLARHATIWVANVLMLFLVWAGLRLRGETCRRYGLTFRWGGLRIFGRTLLLSFVVLIAGLAAFMAGAVVMANLVGMPEQIETGGYNYLSGNLGMFILSLLGVYIVSSFGEEVLYRGFLITRIAELGSSTRLSWWIAVVVSSLVFGAIHSDWGVAGMVRTTCMGLAFAIAYLRFRSNLWILILAHAYMDTLLLLQLYLQEPSG